MKSKAATPAPAGFTEVRGLFPMSHGYVQLLGRDSSEQLSDGFLTSPVKDYFPKFQSTKVQRQWHLHQLLNCQEG
jgi:hypothetical protein